MSTCSEWPDTKMDKERKMPPKLVGYPGLNTSWCCTRKGATLSQKPLLLWRANPQGICELERWKPRRQQAISAD